MIFRFWDPHPRKKKSETKTVIGPKCKDQKSIYANNLWTRISSKQEMLQTGTAVNQIRRHLHMTHFKWRAVNPNVNSVSHSISPQTHLSHTAAASHLSLSSPPPLFSQQSQIDGKSLWGRIDDDHMQQLPISANWSMNVLTHLEQDYSWVRWSWSDWQIWQSKTSLSLSLSLSLLLSTFESEF